MSEMAYVADLGRHLAPIESGLLVGPTRRANAEPALTIKRTGGATMAPEDTTAITVYTNKHKVPFLIDAGDYEAVSHYRWWIGGDRRTGYGGYPTTRIGNSSGRLSTLHGFLLGPAPDGMQWDHINRDKLDNRRANLRAVTGAANRHNVGLRRTNRSGVKGVHWHRHHRGGGGGWVAEITANGRGRYLGIFARLEDAAAARRAAERELWGAASA